jgi:hypothetical protein
VNNGFYLAQMSVSVALAPLDQPQMKGFVNMLELINKLADVSPGFVWRLQTKDGDATAIRGYKNPLKLLNMSLWESVEHLENYVYNGMHGKAMNGSPNWFEKLNEETTVLWWVPIGHTPTVEEGVALLDKLNREGPAPDAFNFSCRYPAPGYQDDSQADKAVEKKESV